MTPHAIQRPITRRADVLLAFALLLLPILLPVPVLAQEVGVCDADGPTPSGAVRLLLLRSDRAVHEYAKTVKDAQVLVRDRKTVVFDDGRIISADPDEVERHLAELGWSKRSLQLVANFRMRKTGRRRLG